MEISKDDLLLPATTLEYYADIHPSRKLYINATSIRYCIENLCDVFLVYFAKRSPSKSWKGKTVADKLNILENEKIFPEDICKRLKAINKVGTRGAHTELHKEMTLADVEIAMNDLGKICEWTLLQYFIKYGFRSASWIATIFSTLPPIYRLNILKEFFQKKEIEYTKDYSFVFPISDIPQELLIQKFLSGDKTITPAQLLRDEFVIIIDKLSMAYLKSNQYAESINFLTDCHKKGYIDKGFLLVMTDKINTLNLHLKDLPISKGLEDARKRFNEILPAIDPQEYSLFLVIFSAIVAQNDVETIKKTYDAMNANTNLT